MSSRGSGGGPLSRMSEVCRERVFSLESSDVLFNPYSGEDPEFDRAGAARIRRSNLLRYFELYEVSPPIVVVAEAPGPWGCRFSGVPITSEEQLVDPAFPLSGEVSSGAGAPHGEYSARIFWRVMRGYFPKFIVWNAVPLHPHRPGESMSIRTPLVTEVRAWLWLTSLLVEELDPDVVVALGRKAETQLGEAGIECTYVRHPSQGGAVAFEGGMRSVFGSLASG